MPHRLVPNYLHVIYHMTYIIMIYDIDLQKEICFQMFADGVIQDMLCMFARRMY